MWLRTVWALAAVKMLTWGIPWAIPQNPLGIFFCLPAMWRLMSPSLPSRDVDAVMLVTTALLARGWHGGPAEKLMLGHCSSRTKRVWFFERDFLACKDWVSLGF